MDLSKLLNNYEAKELPTVHLNHKSQTINDSKSVYHLNTRPENTSKPNHAPPIHPFLNNTQPTRPVFVKQKSRIDRDSQIAYDFSTNLTRIIKENATTADFKSINHPPAPTVNPGIKFSSNSPVRPDDWSPIINIDAALGNGKVCFQTMEIHPLNPGITFLLEPEYTLKQIFFRSYFSILHVLKVTHSFVFKWPNPENPFFGEIAGLRQSTSTAIKEINNNENWELHLKPSKERTIFFGYLIKVKDIQNAIQEMANSLLIGRKLPLVLDLDDTLVRVVGDSPGRYVSVSDSLKGL
jgi:hypothetical protein